MDRRTFPMHLPQLDGHGQVNVLLVAGDSCVMGHRCEQRRCFFMLSSSYSLFSGPISCLIRPGNLRGNDC